MLQKDLTVQLHLKAALYECCPPKDALLIEKSVAFDKACKLSYFDALSYANKDPSSDGNIEAICKTSTSYAASMHYRLAHEINKGNVQLSPSNRNNYARLISSRGKLLSGAEIHFRATIGNNLVLDHGYGTVIGETSHVGNNCYILGGVILGARGIASNNNEKRHPVIGNNVQIGAFTQIFGEIVIGNDVFIGPNCVITEDVADGEKVVNNITTSTVSKYDEAI